MKCPESLRALGYLLGGQSILWAGGIALGLAMYWLKMI